MMDVDGVRIVEPTADHLEWCKRVDLPPPHALLMLDVTLRRLSDGAERAHIETSGFRIDHEGDEQDALHNAEFMWRHGNYGCDCNRGLMFARAADEDDPDVECGHHRYRIVAPDWLAEP